MIRHNALRPKKTITFPRWAEALLILAALGMAVVEGMHDHWLWTVIFGIGGLLFAVSFGARVVTGEKDGHA